MRFRGRPAIRLRKGVLVERHTVIQKNFGICNPNGRILFLSYSFTGLTDDKTIYDSLGINMGDIPFLLNPDFQVWTRREVGSTMIPFKKPKGQELGTVKKQINRAMSELRVKIEHVSLFTNTSSNQKREIKIKKKTATKHL